MAIFDMVDNLTEAIDNGYQALGIFLYLSKVFDSIDHNIVLGKLQNYGIYGIKLQTLSSYLSGRTLYVQINNEK